MPLMPLLFLKAALGGIGRFLSGLTFWQIMCGAALIFAGVQTLRAKSEQRHAFKVEQQLSKCVEARKADSDARNKQREETKGRIIRITRTIHDASRKAEIVEQAPAAPNCRTKPEVMGADL